MHIKKVFSKILVGIFTFIFCLIAVCGIAGCQAFNEGFGQNDINKATSTVYLSEISKIGKDYSNALSDFQNCVKDKDVDAMQNKLNDAQKIIDDFNKLEAPENCANIKQLYSDAFLQLQQALSDYVLVYQDLKDKKHDVTTLQQRITTVKQSYDSGIELLKKADVEASKIEQ